MILLNSILSITLFVLLLCVFIVFSGKILGQSGDVNISINNKKEIVAKKGEKLLSVLAENEIFLPAACGGKGNCGKCKIKITFGVSCATALESLILKESELEEGFRLACQVKTRENIGLEIPNELLLAHNFKARLVSSRNIAYKIKELHFKIESEEEINFKAGQYVQITKELPWEKAIRAYSISSSPDLRKEFTLDVQLIEGGLMSSFLHELPVDSIVSFTGPFGDMLVDLKESDNDDKYYVLIAGGVGLAPMRSIVDYLEKKKNIGKIVLFHGVRSKKNLYYENKYKDLARNNNSFHYIPVLSEPALEDGWTGETGLVTNSVDKWFKNQKIALNRVEAYLCGPSAMMESATKILIELGVDSQNIHSDPFSF